MTVNVAGPSVAGLPRATRCAGAGATMPREGVMGTWLAVELGAALLAAVLWGEPAPTSEPKCDGAAVEVECGEPGGQREGGR